MVGDHYTATQINNIINLYRDTTYASISIDVQLRVRVRVTRNSGSYPATINIRSSNWGVIGTLTANSTSTTVVTTRAISNPIQGIGQITAVVADAYNSSYTISSVAVQDGKVTFKDGTTNPGFITRTISVAGMQWLARLMSGGTNNSVQSTLSGKITPNFYVKYNVPISGNTGQKIVWVMPGNTFNVS